MTGMMLFSGFLAGLIAGVCMVIISEAGYRTGILKSNLIIIDGMYASRLFHNKPPVLLNYLSGILIHLIMSMVFGLVYALSALIIGFQAVTVPPVVIYTLLLWLAMLFIALPIAGWGLLGKKIHRYVWLEQLLLHIVFGIVFYEVLIML